MPVKISIPMFQDLLKSLEKEKLEFDYWLFVAKVYQKPSGGGAAAERVYVNPEEEIFEEFGECKVEIPLTNSSGTSSAAAAALRPSFKIFLLPASKVNDALNKVINLSE